MRLFTRMEELVFLSERNAPVTTSTIHLERQTVESYFSTFLVTEVMYIFSFS